MVNKNNTCLKLFDEVFHQDSTYHFINVAPQWQSFNGGARVFKSPLHHHLYALSSELKIHAANNGNLRLLKYL